MPLCGRLLCAAQGACIYFFLPFPHSPAIPEDEFWRIPEDGPWEGCMALARMQLVCAVSAGWNTRAWPETGAGSSLETQMGPGKVAWGSACPGARRGFPDR